MERLSFEGHIFFLSRRSMRRRNSTEVMLLAIETMSLLRKQKDCVVGGPGKLPVLLTFGTVFMLT